MRYIHFLLTYIQYLFNDFNVYLRLHFINGFHFN